MSLNKYCFCKSKFLILAQISWIKLNELINKNHLLEAFNK